MNTTPAAIETALWALKRQYATIAALTPNDHQLHELALANIHVAFNELLEHLNSL